MKKLADEVEARGDVSSLPRRRRGLNLSSGGKGLPAGQTDTSLGARPGVMGSGAAVPPAGLALVEIDTIVACDLLPSEPGWPREFYLSCGIAAARASGAAGLSSGLFTMTGLGIVGVRK